MPGQQIRTEVSLIGSHEELPLDHDTNIAGFKSTYQTLDSNGNQPPGIYHGFLYVTKWWLWELCGISLSIGSVVAVLALAASIDGKFLSDWKFPLSPNTIVSVLVTISKTSMLLALGEGLSQAKWLDFWRAQRPLSNISGYEDASRGPLGALTFIYTNLRRKTAKVASLGATVSILVLLIGPSAQQIVAVDTVSVSQRGLYSSIKVSNKFDVSSIYETDANALALHRALFDGLFNTDISLGFTCQSGNCSWPDFTTLALCSSCVDVTETTNVTALPYDGYDSGAIIFAINFTFHTPSGFMFSYNVSPGPRSVPIFENNDAFGYRDIANLSIVESQVRFTFDNVTDDASLVSLAVSQQGISQFANNILSELDKKLWDSGNPESLEFNESTTTAKHANTTITECQIRWCARTYQNTSVIHGALSDTVIREQKLLVLIDETETITHPGTSYYISTPGDSWGHGSESIYPFTDSTFLVPDGDSTGYVQSLLASYLELSGVESSPGWTALQYGNNVSDRIKIVTDSLTNAIQTSRDSIDALGTVWVQVPIITIHWAWLSLPAGLVIMTAIFAATVAMASYRRNVPVWKSSIIPFIFHGFEDWTIDELRDMRQGCLEEKSDMETKAETMRVRLARNEFGESRLIRSDM
ncbi:hypothetical protein O1611_g9229 [Lasiodiplodia mahajangana]|uniref:Uncharacterized protein n=1 Tax=Lasiodiplodia mahajangana TaxID=1108764 RepID=A0ACC2JAK4_9PEZI|nr:hypothetical protein O1611_g9229 [Lasiodiplodia mahajangana]